MLKNTILATAATVLLSVPTMAADIVEAPVVVPSWTGFYLGGGVGAAWADFNLGSKFCSEHFFDDGVECVKLNNDFFDEFDFLGRNLFSGESDTAFRGIVQAGFDWELTPGFVAGVFGDYQFGQTVGNSNKEFFSEDFDEGFFEFEDRLSYGIDNMWTLGGRLGFATENALFYGLLGYTSADAETKLKLFCFEGDCLFKNGHSDNVNGVTFGGGIEFKGWLFDTASTALEYRYIDLDDVSARTEIFDDFGFETGDFVKHKVDQNVQEILLTFKWRFGVDEM